MARRVASKRRRNNGGFKRAPKRKRTMVVPGRTRSTGFFGRFAAPGGELKFLDTAIGDTSLTTSGVILNSGSINVIPQDVTESSRVGRKCLVKGIYIKAKLRCSVTATSSEATNLYRIVVYQDKQCNGATATVAQLLQTADILSFRNLENTNRFKFWYDKTRSWAAQAGAGNGTTNTFAESMKYISINLPMPEGVPLEYDNTASTGAIATIRSNNFGIMVICQDSDIAGVIQLQVRVRFSDN